MRIRGVRRSILDISQFYCNECRAVIPLPRHEGRQKDILSIFIVISVSVGLHIRKNVHLSFK